MIQASWMWAVVGMTSAVNTAVFPLDSMNTI